MKKVIYSLSLMIASWSCSSSYLDTAPQSNADAKIIFATTENAEFVINGICKLMCMKHSSQALFGEGTIKVFYGDYPGNDFQPSSYTSYAAVTNGNFYENNTHFINYYPWYYYYKLIGNANAVICHIDDAQGLIEKKQFIKAQALTFRAYSYLMLSQLYCRRWVDSNGDSRGLPLRLDEGEDDDLVASTLAEVYGRIYADLDEAIGLYQSSGLNRPAKDNYSPNIDVAYATYARAALTRGDWENAAHYASLVRKNYPLMSAEEYTEGGFSTPNAEWIWSSYGAPDESEGFASFLAYMASNSSSGQCVKRPGAIAKELYDRIPVTDIRRGMFLDPKEDAFSSSNGLAENELDKRARLEYGTKLYSESMIFAYMQFKFQVQAQPGVGHVNHFRVAEMYLTEAEACCHLAGREKDARQLLQELNSDRDPAYTCTQTGDALLEEVRLYRRIELWGEGFNWFDYKRWNLPIVRKTFAKGGSFASGFAITLNPGDKNNWTFVYPSREVDYNGLIPSSKE
ncbi:MAG: RagB/SusD family nutrient uptake outer membrane protein [Odoribacter sp.]|nr:RagB/SusD family nutrient uptake outer membrane protein [Odoribacter sp.]